MDTTGMMYTMNRFMVSVVLCVHYDFFYLNLAP